MNDTKDAQMAATSHSNRKVLVLAGDGIGPEIMRETMRVMEFFDKRRIASFEVTEGLVGGSSYDAHKTPLTDATLAQAQSADAVLFGSVGGPKWESLPFELQPERGLLRLRKDMDLFANLRPAVVFEALADASSLKRELVAGLESPVGSSRLGNRAASRRCPTGLAAASTPRSTARPRSSASCAPGSSSRASATAASARSTRPTSWNRACCGVR